MLDKFSNHKPIRDEVFTSLRNAILSGHFKPGERLVEKELAEQLDISRTPIREALRKLELEGLVAYEPRKGVIVVGVSSEDALEIYMIRAVLEGLAARLAANKRTENELNTLKKLLFGMEDCIQKDKITKLTSLHASFHNFIAEVSKSPRLYHMIISLHEYVKNFAEIPCYLPGRLHRGWEEHKEIVDAIDEKDNERAEHAARNHIMQAKESLLKAISMGEDGALNEKIRSSLGLQQ
jgi:DNA-binding GntR family transcriptional regulator